MKERKHIQQKRKKNDINDEKENEITIEHFEHKKKNMKNVEDASIGTSSSYLRN